jgi:hypothetical protein
MTSGAKDSACPPLSSHTDSDGLIPVTFASGYGLFAENFFALLSILVFFDDGRGQG